MLLGKRTLLKLAFFALLIILACSILISVFEGVAFFEALYRVVYISLTHHDNFHMDHWPSRIVVISLIAVSLVIIVYLLKALGDYIINLGDGLKRNIVKAKLVNMKDHYIVCGLGRVGINIAQELASESVRFVGIDKDPDRVKEAVAMGYTAFVGDSNKEEDLLKARVDKAKGLVAALGDDSANLFVALSARQLNASIFIVARANREENVERIIRAGANKVAMPNQIGGYHMATMMMRPGVVDFLEVVSTHKNDQLQVEEMVIAKHSQAVGERLHHLVQRAKCKVSVLALNTHDGSSRANPEGKEILYAGDKLIVMGTRVQLEKFNEVL